MWDLWKHFSILAGLGLLEIYRDCVLRDKKYKHQISYLLEFFKAAAWVDQILQISLSSLVPSISSLWFFFLLFVCLFVYFGDCCCFGGSLGVLFTFVCGLGFFLQKPESFSLACFQNFPGSCVPLGLHGIFLETWIICARFCYRKNFCKVKNLGKGNIINGNTETFILKIGRWVCI